MVSPGFESDVFKHIGGIEICSARVRACRANNEENIAPLA